MVSVKPWLLETLNPISSNQIVTYPRPRAIPFKNTKKKPPKIPYQRAASDDVGGMSPRSEAAGDEDGEDAFDDVWGPALAPHQRSHSLVRFFLLKH